MTNRSESRQAGVADPERRAQDDLMETHIQRVPAGAQVQVNVILPNRKAGVPGGWHSGFDRVYEWYYFAHLSPAAKAIYKVFEWRANYNEEFKISNMSQPIIAGHAGISYRSMKKPMDELLAMQLVSVTEKEDRAAQKAKEYVLMLPVMPYPNFLAQLHPSKKSMLFRGGGPFFPEPPCTHGRDLGGMAQTASLVVTVQPASTRPIDPASPVGRALGGRAGALHNKKHSQERDSKSAAVSLLNANGVDASACGALADAYSFDRIVDVVETMEWRRGRGKCDNPGGFIREALLRQWEVPRAVLDARAKRQAGRLIETRRVSELHDADAERKAAEQDEAKIDRAIARLDDDELEILAAEVLKKYQGNAAVTSILTRKPIRECRLMKAEIAAMTIRP